MGLTTYDDVAEFAACVLPRLTADEPRFNLALAVIASLRSGRIVPDAPPLLAVVGDDVAVLHTPPYGLLLTGLPDGAAPDVVDAVVAGGYRPPLVVGPPEAVEPVAVEWCTRTGAVESARRAQVVYAVAHLVPPPPTAGAPRRATPDDAGLVLRWFTDFCVELDVLPRTAPAAVSARIADQDVTLWCVDGTPTSMAAVGGRTSTGARIGPVYTPPVHRGHGYAGAVTAAVTRRCFDQGATQCFLYADLANPTSNGVYQRLGYRRVADSLEVTFGSSAR